MTDGRAVLIHRIAPKYIEAAIKSEKSPEDKSFIEDIRLDAHRHHYGWYLGLQESGLEVTFVDRPSYLVPNRLLYDSPETYVRLLRVTRGRFSPLRFFDALAHYFYLIYILFVFRPDFVMFLFDDLPRALNAFCSWAGITTISDFGDVPGSKSRSVKKQVLRYDYVTAGFDLPALWPEVEEKFYRILPGPSRKSPFLTGSEVKEDVDVCVIGGFGGIFERRSALVEALLEEFEGTETEIRVHGYEYGVGTGSRILKAILAAFGIDDVEIPIEGYEYNPGIEDRFPKLSEHLMNPVYGGEFYSLVKRSRIIITIPNDPQLAIGSIRPMGIMEAAAAGTFQLAIDNEDARSLFEPDEELVLFENAEEMVDAIAYYLANEEDREAIAKASQRRFVEEYCAEEQIKRMISTLALKHQE